MPRLRQVARPDVDDEHVLAMYERLFGDRDPVADPGTATGTPGNWWTVFALVPEALKHATDGFAFYRNNRDLSPALRELAQVRTGWLHGSQFVFSQHCKAARREGLSDEQVIAIPSWQVSDLFSGVERAVLAYTDAFVGEGGRVADGVFEDLKAHLSDVEILELSYIVGLYLMHATISRALRLEYDDVPERVVEIAAPSGDSAHDIGGMTSISDS
jgi:alkylhydroperoxidase family enzyme